MSPTPIYTSENVQPAWQLVWSLTIFWTRPQQGSVWLDELTPQLEVDGIRVLNHRFVAVNRSQFLVSTTPFVAPKLIPSRIKGRLQHLLRSTQPRPFQRNYNLISLGSTQGDKVESYVRSQVEHHLAHDVALRRQFEDLHLSNPDLDLIKPRFNNDARYICNLHLVIVNTLRRQVLERDVLIKVRSMIRRWALRKSYLLSQAALLPDHIHVVLGSLLEKSPIDVALSLMNNIAYVHGMKPVLMASCFLGTFGPYDLGAVQGGDCPGMW